MPKVVYLIIAFVLVLTAATVVSVIGVNASEETKFVPVSVLAEDQANYGVDDKPLAIHAVLPGIIEDKVDDIQSDLVKTIEYTSLPAEDSGLSSQDNDHTQSQGQAETHNSYGNDGSSSATSSVSDPGQNNNQNNNPSNNQGNNGKGKDKNKDKDKGNNGGNGKGNSGGNNQQKVDEKSSGNGNGNGNGQGKVK